MVCMIYQPIHARYMNLLGFIIQTKQMKLFQVIALLLLFSFGEYFFLQTMKQKKQKNCQVKIQQTRIFFVTILFFYYL